MDDQVVEVCPDLGNCIIPEDPATLALYTEPYEEYFGHQTEIKKARSYNFTTGRSFDEIDGDPKRTIEINMPP